MKVALIVEVAAKDGGQVPDLAAVAALAEDALVHATKYDAEVGWRVVAVRAGKFRSEA